MLRGIGLAAGHCLCHQRPEWLLLYIKRDFARAELFHIEQVVDQLGEVLAASQCNLQHRPRLFGQLAQLTAANQAQRAPNRGKWCAQLMADGGDELTLHQLYTLALGDIPVSAEYAQRLATRVPQHSAVGLDPAYLAGGMNHTKLGIEQAFTTDGPLQLKARLTAILGMNTLYPYLVGTSKITRMDTVEGKHIVIPYQLPGIHMIVPDPDPGARGSQGEALTLLFVGLEKTVERANELPDLILTVLRKRDKGTFSGTHRIDRHCRLAKWCEHAPQQNEQQKAGKQCQ